MRCFAQPCSHISFSHAFALHSGVIRSRINLFPKNPLTNRISSYVLSSWFSDFACCLFLHINASYKPNGDTRRRLTYVPARPKYLYSKPTRFHAASCPVALFLFLYDPIFILFDRDTGFLAKLPATIAQRSEQSRNANVPQHRKFPACLFFSLQAVSLLDSLMTFYDSPVLSLPHSLSDPS